MAKSDDQYCPQSRWSEYVRVEDGLVAWFRYSRIDGCIRAALEPLARGYELSPMGGNTSVGEEPSKRNKVKERGALSLAPFSFAYLDL